MIYILGPICYVFFFSFERVSKDMDIVDFIGGILFMVLFSTDV